MRKETQRRGEVGSPRQFCFQILSLIKPKGLGILKPHPVRTNNREVYKALIGGVESESELGTVEVFISSSFS